MTRNKTDVSKLLMMSAAAAVLLFSSITVTQASAANPYTAAYMDTTVNDKPYMISGKITYVGSGPRTNHFGGVISTAGWAGSAVSGWGYQSPVTLYTYNLMVGEPQVWQPGVMKWYDSQGLGYFGSQPYEINWVNDYFLWNSARTNVKFYYEVHFNDGTYALYGPMTYNKLSGDTSTSFASGRQTIYMYPYGNINFKYLQFGIEGFGGTTSGYNAKMYDNYYVYGSGTTKYLSSFAGRSTVGSFSDYTYGSYIYYTPGGGGSQPTIIGNAVWNSDACYYLDSGCSLPTGQVLWHQGGTPI